MQAVAPYGAMRISDSNSAQVPSVYGANTHMQKLISQDVPGAADKTVSEWPKLCPLFISGWRKD